MADGNVARDRPLLTSLEWKWNAEVAAGAGAGGDVDVVVVMDVQVGGDDAHIPAPEQH